MKARRRRRVEPQSLFHLSNRLPAASGVDQDESEVGGGLRIVRLHRNRHVGGIFGLRLASIHPLQQGKHRVRPGIVGIKLEGLPGGVIGNLAGDGSRPEIIIVVAPDIDGDAGDSAWALAKPGSRSIAFW